MTLYSNFQVRMMNNGYFSQYFNKNRGVNQGCPASCGIYLYVSETMTHLINKNSNIKGIPIDNLKDIMSQFADDTSAYLSYEKITINEFLNTLHRVEQQTGLQISFEKTSMYRIGSLANSQAKLYMTRQVNWTS